MSLLIRHPHIKIIQDLAKRRKTAIYLVGGFLRDSLLGFEKRDFDFAVEKDALKFARCFATKIKGAYVLLDEEHGCARVAKKKNKQLYTFDFADFRARTFKGDLFRRDFTINTLYLDVCKLTSSTQAVDVIKDPKNGVKDLKAKCVKMVFDKTFQEDPLRMMRAFSLKATLGFKIERGTLQQIKKDKDLIRSVSYERIREELFKVLESDRAAEGLKAMDRIGLLAKIIPQVRVMEKCTQGGYHHLDVWPHSLETVVQLEKIFCQEGRPGRQAGQGPLAGPSARCGSSRSLDPALPADQGGAIDDYFHETLGGNRTRKALMKLAALLHDIGKPDTRAVKEGGGFSFHGHENVGKNIVRCIAQMLKISTHERYALEDMVQWHLRPGYLSNFKQPSERMLFRYFRDTKEEAASIALLSLADQRSTCGPMTTEEDQQHHEKICRLIVQRYFEKKQEKPIIRLINGNDLIKHLKLKPSPLFSKILSEIEEKQSLGKITTKKQAFTFAKEIVEKRRNRKHTS